MKLLVDELIDAELAHALDVTGARAEAYAVEQVNDLLIFGQRRRLGRLRAAVAEGRRERAEAEGRGHRDGDHAGRRAPPRGAHK